MPKFVEVEMNEVDTFIPLTAADIDAMYERYKADTFDSSASGEYIEDYED